MYRRKNSSEFKPVKFGFKTDRMLLPGHEGGVVYIIIIIIKWSRKSFFVLSVCLSVCLSFTLSLSPSLSLFIHLNHLLLLAWIHACVLCALRPNLSKCLLNCLNLHLHVDIAYELILPSPKESNMAVQLPFCGFYEQKWQRGVVLCWFLFLVPKIFDLVWRKYFLNKAYQRIF